MTSQLSKGRLLCYLALIFGAGVVAGWFAGTSQTTHRKFTPPRPEEIVKALQDRLNAELNLSDEQSKQIAEICDKSAHDMQKIHENLVLGIKLGISNRSVQISAVLNPDQQATFERIEKERQESMGRRRGDSRYSRYGGKDWHRSKGGTNCVDRSTREGAAVPGSSPTP